MSWNASGKAIVDFNGVAIHLDMKNPQKEYGESESEAAIDLATAAVRSILTGRTGGLAGLDFHGGMGLGQFYVTMSGHANPNGKPEDNWANDFMQITVGKEK